MKKLLTEKKKIVILPKFSVVTKQTHPLKKDQFFQTIQNNQIFIPQYMIRGKYQFSHP